MSRKVIIILISLACFFVFNLSANNGLKQIYLSIDKTVYALNEDIYYNIVDIGTCKPLNNTVYNLVLSSASGEIVCKGRHLIKNGSGSGRIAIPGNLVPGIYKVIGYAETIANKGEEYFNQIQITILNSRGNNLPIISKVDSMWSRELAIIDTLVVPKGQELSIPNSIFEDFSRVLNASLVPEACLVHSNFHISKAINIDCDTNNATGGPRLIGRLTKEFQFGDEVYLNLLTSECMLLIDRVNKDGFFSFDLPILYQDLDLVITTNNDSAIINIDNDSFNRFSSFNPSNRFLNKIEQNELSDFLIYNELGSRYYDKKKSVARDSTQKAFYGEPILTFNPDDYIELGSLQEYILELPMHVLLTNKTEFQIFNSDFKRVDDLYKPLILVNNVVSQNVEELLNIKPEEIVLFEIIDKRYSVGDFTYSGIFSIQTNSKTNTVNINSNLQVVRYIGFSKDLKERRVELNCPQQTYKKPALNSTMYWSVADAKDYQVALGDRPGKYIFIVNGFDNNGNIVERSLKVTIK